MFDLPCSTWPRSAFVPFLGFEEYQRERQFRFMPNSATKIETDLSRKILEDFVSDAVFKAFDGRAHREYSRAFVRETVHEILGRFDTDRVCSASLDLYLIVEIARDCWSRCNPGQAQLHAEECRNFAYSLRASLVEFSRRGGAMTRA